ncbi:MAG TPA: PIG-L family deacetylase [Terriglobales bacterium]|nr:PIG-L family deacetylase [Terriglobales bacterium]
MRLLCVTAHPDDEAASFGGTLRLYHDRGVETYVVCLTPGQAASHRGKAKSDHELADIRRKEFAASCEILGIDRGVVLDYADGKLHRLDLYSIVEELVRHIREFRPQVMLTFGPEGAVTGHTDHSMASVFATLAHAWAGRDNRYPDQLIDGVQPHRVQKLYYATANFVLPDRQPVSPPPITTVIQIGDYLETKIAAFEAHTTQAPVFSMVKKNILARGREEMFHLAATLEPATLTQETDLFAGVREEA